MACEKKERLLAAYQSATHEFAATVADLHAKIGTSSLVENQQLQRLTDEARLESEQARLALEQHVASYQC
ncbi:MAG: hypothetical protein J0H14_17540 [Alphaproteobacteria bacterium]|nr:hypothetical protein [Alphaproteobacteria bacterium]